jgi:signal transduction histidine kinase
MQIPITQDKIPGALARDRSLRCGKIPASDFERSVVELSGERFFAGTDRPGRPVNRGPTLRFGQLEGTAPCLEVIEERKRLAHEIHDTLAQGFAGILLQLEAARRLDGTEPCNVFEFLGRARELAKCGLEDARRMLLGLRPKSLEGGVLSKALRQLADSFSRDCGINCSFSASGRARKLPEAVEDELYRVAQEALCNVRKHSRAAAVSMALNFWAGGVVLAIKDNGQGFVPRQPQAGVRGFGIRAMSERANRLGGRMDIDSEPGAGTELTMTVPLRGKTSLERNPQ